MIPAIVIVGYIVIGLVAARWVFSRAVKNGNYEPRWDAEIPPTGLFMMIAFILSPLYALAVVVIGVGRILTARPPTPKVPTEQRIAELEKELGL